MDRSPLHSLSATDRDRIFSRAASFIEPLPAHVTQREQPKPRLRLIEARARAAGFVEILRGKPSDEEIAYCLQRIDRFRAELIDILGERMAAQHQEAVGELGTTPPAPSEK